jgi:hypothetical protein
LEKIETAGAIAVSRRAILLVMAIRRIAGIFHDLSKVSAKP